LWIVTVNLKLRRESEELTFRWRNTTSRSDSYMFVTGLQPHGNELLRLRPHKLKGSADCLNKHWSWSTKQHYTGLFGLMNKTILEFNNRRRNVWTRFLHYCNCETESVYN
jgi:hypothetical protein